MIASFIDGRIRIRDEKLKSISTGSHIKTKLLQFKGITDVTINHRTGSLLILYDKVILRLEHILHVLADYLEVAKIKYSKGINFITDRKIVNIGMLSSLALSMFGAVADATSLHIIAGVIFLGFLALHLFRYKNMLFA